MVDFIAWIFAICFVILICYSLYMDTKNEIWNILLSSFNEIPARKYKIRYKDKMVFFKAEKETEYDYFNSMKVAIHDDGIEFQATINHFFLKPLFLPYASLEKVGSKRLFLLRRTVYKVLGKDIFIAL